MILKLTVKIVFCKNIKCVKCRPLVVSKATVVVIITLILTDSSLWFSANWRNCFEFIAKKTCWPLIQHFFVFHSQNLALTFFRKKRSEISLLFAKQINAIFCEICAKFFFRNSESFFLRINAREKVCEVGKESRKFSFFRGDKCLSCILISAEYTVFTRTVGVN